MIIFTICDVLTSRWMNREVPRDCCIYIAFLEIKNWKWNVIFSFKLGQNSSVKVMKGEDGGDVMRGRLPVLFSTVWRYIFRGGLNLTKPISSSPPEQTPNFNFIPVIKKKSKEKKRKIYPPLFPTISPTAIIFPLVFHPLLNTVHFHPRQLFFTRVHDSSLKKKRA
jgi:hypothetical protein